MRHVDEGELHAWLDGALDAWPADEVERIREHLGSCPDCRERLEEERAVREAARDILEAAGPGALALPTFEELRERARQPPAGAAGATTSPRSRSGTHRGVALAWAASVILALGVGWVGRTAWVENVQGPGAPSLSADARSAGTGSAPASGEAVSDELERERPAEERSSEQARLLRPSAPAPAEEGDRDTGADRRATPPAGDPAAAAGRAARAETGPSPAPRGGVAAFADSAPAAPPERVDAREMEELDSVIEAEREARARALAGPPSNVTAPMALPGLPIETVERLAGPPGSGLRVVQRLADGEPLELRWIAASAVSLDAVVRTPAEPTADALAAEAGPEGLLDAEVPLGDLPPGALPADAFPEGWSRIVLARAGGWLVAAAPVPERELRELLERLP